MLLVERRSFDAQQAVDYYTALFGEGVELRENQYSYAEVLTDLQNTMKGMFVEIDPETGEQIWAPYEGQEEEIARLQQLLAKTPAEDTFVPLTAEAMPFPAHGGDAAPAGREQQIRILHRYALQDQAVSQRRDP